MTTEAQDTATTRAIVFANQVDLRLRARGLVMSQDFQLALYHFIRNGRCACPGGECCAGEESGE